MKTEEKKKEKIDAVKMMRQIRDKISSETSDMSYEELKTYINKRLKKEAKSTDSGDSK